ncbi:response regulator [Marinibactrum halimedae]|uniref:Response regulator n=1 Tax=Marinibactrum halimedae TaxID=1444977 RepID=A0AA37T727_9GAMM|nr:response regulator [Marinibactrum halimedae]MCD9459791.1 response regulator [Marinibactrum halimedae]GLS27016.1 response regulator [Marinibactrum halimedae]
MHAKSAISEITVFVVEDDDVDFMTIERSFHHERIANTIIRAKDGIEAFELMKNDKIPQPYITLLDLRMPRLDGLGLLNKIRSDDSLKSTTIFVLTTSSDDTDINKSYERNVAGYFVKDQVGKEFIDMIQMLEGYWRIVHLPHQNDT